MAQSRLPFEAGIAVGPILFVVAILAIIATANGASTSTLGVNASQETNRVNAMAMIHIGSTLSGDAVSNHHRYHGCTGEHRDPSATPVRVVAASE